ncbi:FGFR1 oncogene partner 2 homolog [Hyalella azteca]|uniref:FGFR1 oncogene partner 2 homolog n=1 Tax=Hyalella azteca TaxID=294128 RepID=A0A8B7NQB7_HYAAZ|nr:FGFR1 oncogene partner 2 homolog [Hyalella azteca]
MSVLQQVLSDARKLATRLRDHDSSTDNLLSQAQGMFKQVESMKEYCEEMNQLNEVANNRPRGQLIHSIQQENRYIRELQEENKELRMALEEQQTVMELIMSKYREQVAKLLTSSPDALRCPHTAALQRQLGDNIERVSEMVSVMRRAAQLDEDQSFEYQEQLSSLARENRGLREMLQIAIKSGSVVASQRHDAITQTGSSVDTDTIKLNPNFGSDTDTIKLNPSSCNDASCNEVPPLVSGEGSLPAAKDLSNICDPSADNASLTDNDILTDNQHERVTDVSFMPEENHRGTLSQSVSSCDDSSNDTSKS